MTTSARSVEALVDDAHWNRDKAMSMRLTDFPSDALGAGDDEAEMQNDNPGCYVPLSDGEAERIRAQVVAENRRLRMRQVREQENRLAAVRREKYKVYLASAIKKETEMSRRKWEAEKASESAILNEKYRSFLKDVGKAHRQADVVTAEWSQRASSRCTQSQTMHEKAKTRCRKALASERQARENMPINIAKRREAQNVINKRAESMKQRQAAHRLSERRDADRAARNKKKHEIAFENLTAAASGMGTLGTESISSARVSTILDQHESIISSQAKHLPIDAVRQNKLSSDKKNVAVKRGQAALTRLRNEREQKSISESLVSLEAIGKSRGLEAKLQRIRDDWDQANSGTRKEGEEKIFKSFSKEKTTNVDVRTTEVSSKLRQRTPFGLQTVFEDDGKDDHGGENFLDKESELSPSDEKESGDTKKLLEESRAARMEADLRLQQLMDMGKATLLGDNVPSDSVPEDNDRLYDISDSSVASVESDSTLPLSEFAKETIAAAAAAAADAAKAAADLEDELDSAPLSKEEELERKLSNLLNEYLAEDSELQSESEYFEKHSHSSLEKASQGSGPLWHSRGRNRLDSTVSDLSESFWGSLKEQYDKNSVSGYSTSDASSLHQYPLKENDESYHMSLSGDEPLSKILQRDDSWKRDEQFLIWLNTFEQELYTDAEYRAVKTDNEDLSSEKQLDSLTRSSDDNEYIEGGQNVNTSTSSQYSQSPAKSDSDAASHRSTNVMKGKASPSELSSGDLDSLADIRLALDEARRELEAVKMADTTPHSPDSTYNIQYQGESLHATVDPVESASESPVQLSGRKSTEKSTISGADSSLEQEDDQGSFLSGSTTQSVSAAYQARQGHTPADGTVPADGLVMHMELFDSHENREARESRHRQFAERSAARAAIVTSRATKRKYKPKD